MNIQKDISLKPYNTFGIDVKASKFANITSIEQLLKILEKDSNPFILSGGSNVLLTSDIDQLVLYLNLKGLNIFEESDTHVYIKAQAGENWHEFVQWCIANDFGGLENLSLIPGNVGTSPMQNIGAYGVEIKDTFHKLKAIEIATGKRRVFTNEECNFGYRNSVFKNELKGKYIITSVIFKLTKKNHQLNYSYGAIQSELEKNGIETPTIKDISEAVIKIRNSKLPNPKEIGNSGSFFKNPVISSVQFEKLKNQFPSIPSYVVSDSEIKVPAGWLIEQSGFKGKRFGDAGVHDKQALVLVNHGNATGIELKNLAQNIQQTVVDKFGITLEIEVNII
ncbi:UDP-N-acetylmuramate dehydrogenase [Urechidicola vernalis]|uniref:UDP-N-acetylenolpyruvoylglucosamine reductase n=1 Tax=Urechidicola vernalis TaxID=3075600 RepID=A0ABU2Y6S0_9FLAO|nr:UDP-N-acetylmuramate dehydrogenase [Urechidicola sp. P050]MDT0553899.1 UDP-N-acetylmuramate dehydrogenase [Urechidicola sp. P050]